MSLRRPAKPVVMGTAWLLIMLGAIVAGAKCKNHRRTIFSCVRKRAGTNAAAASGVAARRAQRPAESLSCRRELGPIAQR